MKRILIIDDDKSVRNALELSLRRHGYVACGAESGHIGLAAFGASQFDVVMVDIFMPGMEGLEVINRLRERAPAMPIIAMSGFRFRIFTNSVPDFLDMALKLGVTYCLRKPFGYPQLQAAIDACLHNELPRAA